MELLDSLAAYKKSKAVAAFTPLRIVHLSDLHFVTHPILSRLESLYKGLKGHDTDTKDALETKIRDLKPDLILATGDHTTWGDKKSLQSARTFLVRLGQQNDLSEDRLFWIPGNHDVLLHYYFGLLGLRRNYEVVFGPTQPLRLLDTEAFKVAVFSFDSTLDHKWRRSLLWGSRGQISRRAFNEFNRLRQETLGLDQHVKIALVHHHPLPIPFKDEDEVGLGLTTMANGGTFIAYMQESGISLILHGHEHCPYSCRYCHDPAVGDIILVAAGTACQAGTHPCSFNYLEVIPDVRVVIRRYKYEQVGFRIDRSGTKIFALGQT